MVQNAGQVKSVFDLPSVPAFKEFYDRGIYIWKYLYRGYYKDWHHVKAPTIANPGAYRDMERLGVAKAIAQELASLVWSEQCKITATQKMTSTEAQGGQEDKLNEFVNQVLADNNFTVKMQELIEQGFALGGATIRVWCETDKITQKPKIRLGYCMADQFIPLSWDNADVYEGVFIFKQAKNGYYYTRLEWHKWDGQTYYIENELYKNDYKHTCDQSVLGIKCPLTEIYSSIAPLVPFKNMGQSLFSYFRPNIANNMDDNSPLGISIYANALSTLKALDICYDSFVREFKLGRKRIIVPSECVRTVMDENGNERRYFDATDEAFVALDIDDSDKMQIIDNSVEIRVDEHVSAINAFLGILCLQIGLSPGTLTFDKVEGLKTATEVISEKSKTYKTVVSHEITIKTAIEKMVRNIINIALIYDLDYEGVKVSSLVANGYDIKVSFDDSIIQDKSADIDEGIKLVTASLESKYKFLTTRLKMTDKEAQEELKRIADESVVSGDTSDAIINGMGWES